MVAGYVQDVAGSLTLRNETDCSKGMVIDLVSDRLGSDPVPVAIFHPSSAVLRYLSAVGSLAASCRMVIVEAKVVVEQSSSDFNLWLVAQTLYPYVPMPSFLTLSQYACTAPTSG